MSGRLVKPAAAQLPLTCLPPAERRPFGPGALSRSCAVSTSARSRACCPGALPDLAASPLPVLSGHSGSPCSPRTYIPAEPASVFRTGCRGLSQPGCHLGSPTRWTTNAQLVIREVPAGSVGGESRAS